MHLLFCVRILYPPPAESCPSLNELTSVVQEQYEGYGPGKQSVRGPNKKPGPKHVLPHLSLAPLLTSQRCLALLAVFQQHN